MPYDAPRRAGPAQLAIVVVNYGSSALLERNLVGVTAHVPDATVVVVDNRTTAEEAATVERLASTYGWRTILEPDNRGFGAAANRGVELALAMGSRDLLLLNPDATIDATGIGLLRDAVAIGRLAAAAPVITDVDGRIWFAGVDLLPDGSMRSWQRREEGGVDGVPWLTGACLLVTAEAWAVTGGFDEEYFLYWEDVDLSRRITDAGGSLIVVQEARAVHDEGGTQRSGARRAKSEIYYYYNIRNRLLFAAKHLPPAQMREWRRTAPTSAREVVFRGGRRQLLTSFAPIRAAWRGIRDGRRAVDRSLAAIDDP